jgi:hypothetical protein
MRPSNKSRSRNKSGNNGNHNNRPRNSMGNIINRVFESAGPDGKVRGTPQQIIDKYQALARDAQVAGDRVAAESYLQHSEHYSRLLGEAQRQLAETRSFNEQREDGQREEGGIDGQQRRQQQPAAAQQMGSGLAMIDPEDADDMGGPIDTPEGRRPQSEPAPAVVRVIEESSSQPVPAEAEADPFNGVEATLSRGPAPAAVTFPEGEPAAAPKRPRPRRRHKPEGEAAAEGAAGAAEEAQPS